MPDIFLVTGGVNEREHRRGRGNLRSGMVRAEGGRCLRCLRLHSGHLQGLLQHHRRCRSGYSCGCVRAWSARSAPRPSSMQWSKESAYLRGKVEEAQRREEERGVSVMELNETFVPLALEDLVDTAREYKEQGYQLAQMMGVLKEDGYRLALLHLHQRQRGHQSTHRRDHQRWRPKCLRSRRSISLSS